VLDHPDRWWRQSKRSVLNSNDPERPERVVLPRASERSNLAVASSAAALEDEARRARGLWAAFLGAREHHPEEREIGLGIALGSTSWTRRASERHAVLVGIG
jgi:hypothetical protein